MKIIPLSSYKVMLKHFEDHLILGHLSETFSITPLFLSVHAALLIFLVSSLKPLSSHCENTLNTLALAPHGAVLFQVQGLWSSNQVYCPGLEFNRVMGMRKTNVCFRLCWGIPRQKSLPAADQYCQEWMELAQRCVSLMCKGLLNIYPQKSLFSSCFPAVTSRGDYLIVETVVELISMKNCHKLLTSYRKH